MKKLPNGKWQVRWRDKTRKQRARNFKTQELARVFLRKLDRGEVESEKPGASRAFSEVVAAWRSAHYPTIAVASRVTYDRRIRLKFGPLMGLPLRAITPTVIDTWIAGMVAGKSKRQQTFCVELKILGYILRFALDDDEDGARLPIRKRHYKAVRLKVSAKPKAKDISELEFRRFLVALERGRDGAQMVPMAIIQWKHALRVSEVAGLHWEDVLLVTGKPEASRIAFRWHVVYARDKAIDDFLEPGIKNSDGKSHPMFPAVFQALSKLPRQPSGLVFRQPKKAGLPVERQFWDYRTVIKRYDRAFARAGLPYTSSHVFRYGGTQSALDKVNGDRDVARHLLGNEAVVELYARRSARVLDEFAAKAWAAELVSAPVEDSAATGAN